MEELTKTEEKIMQILWEIKKGFVKDIIERMDDESKPPYTTISSVVRILENKGFVDHKAYGKTHEYYPAISKSEYRKANFKRLVKNYFDGSTESLLSFMVKEEKLDEKELQKLKDIINKKS
ncbi:BlaI/MecI/CopY family transcriptional regulator [Solitalea koreensis]|uniref:Predicted transcriptional regulator n=1 Tax=Solitalea koreensis TaxID=543615 RepID=A0A521C306_9SPHI|nr:BlaI/MecI/CopY family transcriptional regulator [Solitalea koreensis]SMO53779.1 Predicted transcriptional regulator [Solitalea koreensis]